MSGEDDRIERALQASSHEQFDRRVESQAAELADSFGTGAFDNPTFGIGIELELYAVDDGGRLTEVPKSAFGGGCDKELGKHNAELHTDPNRLTEAGIEAQTTQLRQRYERANDAAGSGTTIVPNAMWSVPPKAGAKPYLSATEDGRRWVIASNMTPSVRYYAIDNAILDRAGGTVPVSVPGVDAEFPSILVESLTSSIQPHLQIPDLESFPRYHTLAIRTLGPVLAVATNSPLLPVDLYDVEDPHRLLEETHHELRIPVFEQSVNEGWSAPKVRFPEDIDEPETVLERLVEDLTCAPFLREWIEDDDRGDSLGDRYWELNYKRGTYWRWARAVVGGQPVAGGTERSIRIEYRPIPTQPTIRGNVGMQCLVAGLLRGLVVTDHPLAELEHEAAKESFYSAVESGIDADLAWVTENGTRTTDSDVIFEELFDLTRRGLRERGVSEETIARYIGPIEHRWEAETTPSVWKLDRVREGLDAGKSLSEAVREMQREYVDRSGDEPPFSTWIGD
ncbi:MAG: hypothetical protein PPP58_00180 [Natronomonas sp.]